MSERFPMLPPAADSVRAFSSHPATEPESRTLTSESRKPAGGLSRRLMLAGLAAGAVAAPTIAAAMPPDAVFALIEAKREADVAHSVACDVLSAAEKRYGFGSDEVDAAFDAQGVACNSAHEACVRMVSTPATTLAGVLAVLRFANELQEMGIWIEDMELEQQLIATTADAIQAIICKGAVA